MVRLVIISHVVTWLPYLQCPDRYKQAIERTGVPVDRELAVMIQQGLTYLMSPSDFEYKRGAESASQVIRPESVVLDPYRQIRASLLQRRRDLPLQYAR